MADGEILGLGRLLSGLASMPAEATAAAASELYTGAEQIIGDSVENYVPVDEGILRGSAFVEEPKIDGDEISVALGFGGPASDYAMAQHERMDFHHTVGQAKYLEIPARNWWPSIPPQVAEAVRDRLRRIFQW